MEHVASESLQPKVPHGSLVVFRELLACVAVYPAVVFTYDVPAGTYVADIPSPVFAVLAVSGPMSLAIYNDLKLSQFIREDDGQSRPGCRQFTLTEHGRRQVEASST